jgi:DeoR/GlpR family transcriptional regulator of sugar metabolism
LAILDASPATIRVPGGAKLADANEGRAAQPHLLGMPIDQPITLNLAAKQAIDRAAAGDSRQTVMIDGGASTLQICAQL